MNSVISNFDETVDTSAIFTKLKELFPKAKGIESVTVLKEFTELAYKDYEMDVKFKFLFPHTIMLSYKGDEWVSIEDKEFEITLGNETEAAVMLDYICYLDYFWDDYIAKDLSNRKMTQRLKEKIETIRSKVKKIW
ncbi:MAG: hypothetical protein FWG34_13790 [Oscillospiraceae bacterium]|nr:hypothetical protein [Oscillospiraceae bacterium]